ncbi:MAG: response regulator [Caldithrix sp.]|nr:response regulator [Caldithrix sp.]
MHKILIIDDDSDIRQTLTALLETEGYETAVADSAQAGEEQLNNEQFSTILLDIFLPDSSGIDFLTEIQKKGVIAPIIIITGSSDLKLARQALRLGVFDYLVKPFKDDTLQQVVRKAVDHNYLLEEKIALEEQNRRYQTELEKMVETKVAELRESEQKYQKLIEQSLVGVFILQDNVFKYVNNKFCEILGYTSDEVVNQKHLADFALPEYKSMVKTALQGLKHGQAKPFNFKVISKEGQELILEIWAGMIQYEGHTAVQGLLSDISYWHYSKLRERRLELELLQENKMSAIGRLSAGISHNLNNPISIIQANAELLKMRSGSSPELEKIIKQTQRMTDLINTIVKKGKKEQDTQKMNININTLLEEELEFLKANLFYKHQVDKQFSFAENLPNIKGIYSDFSQSINAIIMNAIEAMQDSELKTLHIKTDFNDNFIYVHIEDTGVGIKKADLDRIFEPFFSTKMNQKSSEQNQPQNVGAGLGLSIVYKLLYPYKIKMDINSVPDEGTKFILQIPYQ